MPTILKRVGLLFSLVPSCALLGTTPRQDDAYMRQIVRTVTMAGVQCDSFAMS